MECNRDEALRAKMISEEKLMKGDYVGAKKIAIIAQNLFPTMEGISQLIATIDVYISSGNKPFEEVDWYGILNVDQSANDETIRKQYKKLALVLHPDKNKSVGAEGAFKIVLDAWNLLSDNEKRLAYNQRIAFKRFPQTNQVCNSRNRTSTQNAQAADQASQSGADAAHNFGNMTQVPNTAGRSQQKRTSNAGSKTTSVPEGQSSGTNKARKRKPAQPSQKPDTFWTLCNQCKFHYEFVRMYVNCTLLCDTCKKPFLAKETAPPPDYLARKEPREKNKVSGDVAPIPNDLGPDAKKSGPDDSSNNAPAAKKTRQGPSSNHGVGKNVTAAERSGTGSNQHTHGKNVPSAANSGSGPNQNAHGPQKNVQAANKSGSGQGGFKWVRNANKEKVPHSGTANVGSRDHPTGAKARAKGNVPVAPQEQIKRFKLDGTGRASRVNGFSGTRDISILDYRKMLLAMSREDIQIRLNCWKSEEEDSLEKHDGKSDLSTDKAAEPMIVPDPDFHDFDNDRTECSFGDNEVWSAYDDKDGMPRLYALIHKVDCRKPFKLTISWLNSKTNAEFSSMDWVSSGFYKTCGEYRVGKYEHVRSINAFSQKVNFSKTKQGSVLIFPQKDEVWALYKKWSFEWNRHTPKEVVQKYDMVKVLDDYREEIGIFVVPLVKVAGFKTVFRPDLDPHVIKRIPKEEMLRFSHRVPHHVLTGQEAQNAPKECLELDPASTPLELLQVITEANKHVIPS